MIALGVLQDRLPNRGQYRNGIMSRVYRSPTNAIVTDQNTDRCYVATFRRDVP